ncbi:MAG: hypothetical protein M3Y72_18430 [Acidobacteriota bacterium]|nr:hypothetical protein [Acidobacteriota bacterium]
MGEAQVDIIMPVGYSAEVLKDQLVEDLLRSTIPVVSRGSDSAVSRFIQRRQIQDEMTHGWFL